MNDRPLSISRPWDAPLKNYIDNFPLAIAIYDKDDNIVHEETIDYGNSYDRKKLGRITFWACNEGYTVETNKVIIKGE